MSSAAHIIRPHALLLASRFDLTCDFLIAKLRAKSTSYFRLNSEDLSDSVIELDPVREQLMIRRGGKDYALSAESLRSVLFRRPVFLRESGYAAEEPARRFSRAQWATFTTSLILFREATWVNDPVATYRAEHKALQLSLAAKLGFPVPETRITNAPHPRLLPSDYKQVAVKGLDTVLVRDKDQETFGYTIIQDSGELDPDGWGSAPGIIQAALAEKVDLRVTVVEDHVFAASITAEGRGISGDWRAEKALARFSSYQLPAAVEGKCIELVRSLGLRFGGIDLALHKGEYYFLEINPTGEWAWLVDSAGLPIDDALASLLSR